jgi:hypothetical protein
VETDSGSSWNLRKWQAIIKDKDKSAMHLLCRKCKYLVHGLNKVKVIKADGIGESDFWIMHSLWGLQNLKFDFYLK